MGLDIFIVTASLQYRSIEISNKKRVKNSGKMRKVSLMALMLLSACHTNVKKESTLQGKTNPAKKEKADSAVKKPAMNVFENDGSVYRTKEGLVYLDFGDSTAAFMFGLNRCSFSFPTRIHDDKVEIIWDLSGESCDYKTAIKKKFKGIISPNKGDVFAIAPLKREPVFNIDYKYKDFVAKLNTLGPFNELEIDTFFPKTFYLAN